MTQRPETLGALRASSWAKGPRASFGVRDELRANLVSRLSARQPIFPAVHGFDDSVVPALVNAVLSRHSLILLGLRGQAKSRILRGLAGLLDDAVPALAGCEIHDHPLRPICGACRARVEREGDATPIVWLEREARFVEKLATPDVTVADIIGDLDPIRAAKAGLSLSDELTMHYGLLPRANRGIFAINELPDLAGKVQVSLFNIMQEGDVQVKGYPVRLKLDVALVFTANPDDYTARGKIITPLKDRIGSEIRTHYPASLEIGMRITGQEAWLERHGAGGVTVRVPDWIAEIVERSAFAARADSRIDKRSGVSQRLPISCLENVVSNAERRALRNGETTAEARLSDIYAALPAVTGKLELEYEGELRGAEVVARELVQVAVGQAFEARVGDADAQPIVAWFDEGGMLRLDDDASDAERAAALETVPGLEKLARSIAKQSSPAALAGAAELVLEGLAARKRISRSEERLYMKAEPSLAPGRRRRAPEHGHGPGPGGFDFDDGTMQ